jgi:iron-sulfur cluster repair protein YtfE (RIC family)
MSTIVEFLGSDHHACDDLFASAEDAVAQQNWDSARTMFNRFQAAMAHHMAMEEIVLFPAFEAHTQNSTGPMQDIRQEHEQIRELLTAMTHAVAASDYDGYLGLSGTLNLLIQQHNLKEETMLYPMSDQVLGSESERLIDSMEAVPQEEKAS